MPMPEAFLYAMPPMRHDAAMLFAVRSAADTIMMMPL